MEIGASWDDSVFCAFVWSCRYVHEMVTFSKVSGLRLYGGPETAHSWFPGKTIYLLWRCSWCVPCKEQQEQFPAPQFQLLTVRRGEVDLSEWHAAQHFSFACCRCVVSSLQAMLGPSLIAGECWDVCCVVCIRRSPL